MVIDVSAISTVFLSHNHAVACETTLPHYGWMEDANSYFDNRLRSQDWTDAELSDRSKALTMATRAIERLNFEGDKTDDNQMFQFPRGGSETVPAAIKIACYEEAISLLSGADPNMEQANLSIVSQGITSVRATYNRTSLPENIMAGITSYTAWSYLLPYLRDPGELAISRAN